MLHQFCPDVAKEFGVNIAIFLQNMAFWTQKNLANEKHIYDGYCWTYNTLDAFTEIFPYFTKKQIRTIIDNALENWLIIKGNYNKVKFDHTGWYALTPKAYAYFKQLEQARNINLLGEAFKAICPKGHIEKPKRAHRYTEKGTPIPDSKPDNKENNNYVITKESEETNLPAKTNSKPLVVLQEINSLDLPNEYLDELIKIRKVNGASTNKKAMQAVYQELVKLKEAGLDLNECLNMYANCGWKGFVADWFIKGMVKKPSTHLDHDSIQWGKDMETNPFFQNLDWIK